MNKSQTPAANEQLLKEPRERCYVLGHIAFRQICALDSHYFFSLMASPKRDEFLSGLIEQVEQNCPDDSTLLNAESIKVATSRVRNHPLILIEMPPVKALAEAIYVGLISMFDMTQQPDSQKAVESHCYTLEYGENDDGVRCFFCLWEGKVQKKLAELEAPCSVDDFGMLIDRHVETTVYQ
jgi:hypothetical protein